MCQCGFNPNEKYCGTDDCQWPEDEAFQAGPNTSAKFEVSNDGLPILIMSLSELDRLQKYLKIKLGRQPKMIDLKNHIRSQKIN